MSRARNTTDWLSTDRTILDKGSKCSTRSQHLFLLDKLKSGIDCDHEKHPNLGCVFRPLVDVTFTTALHETGLQQAAQCWSEIRIWRNSSAEWYNSHIANRTWPVGYSTSTFLATFNSSSTFYPDNVSTYKLCDGSPRADVQPSTTHWSGVRTSSWSYTTEIFPTFSIPQPCRPDPHMCRLWWYESNIQDVDEDELGAQCAYPAHLNKPCLIGGGPVQLYYFPVTTESGNLCAHNKTIFSTAPAGVTTLRLITTHGHTFNPGSAYISFNTLYASYDGFWDRVGPTFSDLVLPFASSEISSHCGGWGSAFGHGTQLNYADLNWPVPASAYACQERCPETWTSKYEFCTSRMTNNDPRCSTIWSDVDPVLALPTRVRELAPEWKSCKFWDGNIPNFWFDPPVPLQPRAEAVTPTVPTVRSTSTAAAPVSSAVGTQPEQTAFSSTKFSFHPTPAASTRTSEAEIAEPTLYPRDSGDATADPATEAVRSDATSVPSSPEADGPSTDKSTQSSGVDPAEPSPIDSDGESVTSPVLSSTDPELPSPAAATTDQADPNTIVTDDLPLTEGPATAVSPSSPPVESAPSPLTADSQTVTPITAPALSILASALDPLTPDIPSSVQSLISDAISDANSMLHPEGTESTSPMSPGNLPTATDSNPTTSPSDLFLTLGSTTAVLSQTSGSIILGTAHLSVGQETTVCDVPIVVYDSALLIGSTFVPLPAVTTAVGGVPEAGSSEMSTLAFGSLTLTAGPVPTNTNAAGVASLSTVADSQAPQVISAHGTALTLSGTGAVIGEGTTLSYGSDGLVVYASGRIGTMSEVTGSPVVEESSLPGIVPAASSSASTRSESRSESTTGAKTPISAQTGDASDSSGNVRLEPGGWMWTLLVAGLGAWMIVGVDR